MANDQPERRTSWRRKKPKDRPDAKPDGASKDKDEGKGDKARMGFAGDDDDLFFGTNIKERKGLRVTRDSAKPIDPLKDLDLNAAKRKAPDQVGTSVRLIDLAMDEQKFAPSDDLEQRKVQNAKAKRPLQTKRPQEPTKGLSDATPLGPALPNKARQPTPIPGRPQGRPSGRHRTTTSTQGGPPSQRRLESRGLPPNRGAARVGQPPPNKGPQPPAGGPKAGAPRWGGPSQTPPQGVPAKRPGPTPPRGSPTGRRPAPPPGGPPRGTPSSRQQAVTPTRGTPTGRGQAIPPRGPNPSGVRRGQTPAPPARPTGRGKKPIPKRKLPGQGDR